MLLVINDRYTQPARVLPSPYWLNKARPKISIIKIAIWFLRTIKLNHTLVFFPKVKIKNAEEQKTHQSTHCNSVADHTGYKKYPKQFITRASKDNVNVFLDFHAIQKDYKVLFQEQKPWQRDWEDKLSLRT